MAETITITKTEYDQLKSDSDWLNCLNLAGVDNWEGIGYAQKLHSKWHPEEDDEDDGDYDAGMGQWSYID